MGLDNGLYFKDTKEKEFREKYKIEMLIAHKIFKAVFPNDEYVNSDFIKDYHFEIAYWRKCWNVRGDIIRASYKSGNNMDEYQWQLGIDDLKKVIKSLELYLDEDYFNRNDDTIWEYDSFKRTTEYAIRNIKFAIFMMKIHPELECWFYDSY